MSRGDEHDKVTWATLQACKRAGRRISVLTCYDAPTAGLMEEAGVEVLLVGDTAAEVILGLPSTREIPPEFLLALTAAVRRGAPRCFVMADLPWACRGGDDRATLRWARRFIEEGGADGLKVEVTGDDVPLVRRLSEGGIPLIAHIGLLPQRIDPAQGYRAKGRDAVGAIHLMEEARALEDAGAAGLLLEAVASEVAKTITEHASVPVIGCVAGPHCDGTVVVLHDMIGHAGGHPPRKVRRYADLAGFLRRAFADYVADIHAGRFPTEEHGIRMKPGECDRLHARLLDGRHGAAAASHAGPAACQGSTGDG